MASPAPPTTVLSSGVTTRDDLLRGVAGVLLGLALAGVLVALLLVDLARVR